MRIVALSVLGLSLVACSKKENVDTPQPEPSAAPAPSASAGTAISAQSAVPAEHATPEDPEADFVEVQGVSGHFFAVGDAVLVCGGGCTFPADPPPPMWIIENGKAREAPELWPANAWTGYASMMKKEHLTSSVSFSGEYPKQLFARAWGEGRTGDGNLPAVKFFVKYWVDGTESNDLKQYKRPVSPREYDEALLSLPTKQDPRSTFIYGGGGPPMAAEPNSLWIRKGKEWVRKLAPWVGKAELRRLADGDTLATGSGVHRISKDGAIQPLKATKPAGTIVSQGGVAYLVSSSSLLKPTHPERFKLAALEKRTESRSMVFKKPQAADAGADGGGTDPSLSLSEPGEHTEACTTPVVYVHTSEGYLPSASSLGDLFQKHADQALAYPVYKVSFSSGQRYLVRAKDNSAAQAMLGWVQEQKDLAGELKCVNLDALTSDPEVSKEQIERVYVHPWSGSLIPLW